MSVSTQVLDFMRANSEPIAILSLSQQFTCAPREVLNTVKALVHSGRLKPSLGVTNAVSWTTNVEFVGGKDQRVLRCTNCTWSSPFETMNDTTKERLMREGPESCPECFEPAEVVAPQET